MELGTSLTVPRGVPNLDPLILDMTRIYTAEGRIGETKSVNSLTAPELKATFNEACSITTKYMAWIKYEILMAEKYLALAKAEVIIDKLPNKIQELKEKGIKDNSDIRDALVVRDPDYQARQNALYALEAVKALLDSKAKTFERAYWDCRSIAEDRDKFSGYPSTSHKQNALSEVDLSAGFAIGVSKF